MLDVKTVITMLITVVLSEVIKKLVGYGLDHLKNSQVMSNINIVVKRWANKFVFAVLTDLGTIGYIFLKAVTSFSGIEPATKHDLFFLFTLCAMLITFSLILVRDYIDLNESMSQ
jgi:hypothetical protein